MSQITSGIRAILGNPLVYDLFQDMMGADSVRADLVKNDIRPFVNCRILDIGCGTARILDYFPPVEYFGFDLSEEYISSAKKRYGKRGAFSCGLVDQTTVSHLESFDIVLAIGLIHHLSDEETQALMKLAMSALRTGGRLVTIDPCFAEGQNAIAKFLVSRDRGQNVRVPEQYKALAQTVFSKIEGQVKHRKWIPYTHWVMECTK